MKKKVYTLLSPDHDTNSYNWSFWEDRALVRVEERVKDSNEILFLDSHTQEYKSKIVEYKFDYKNKTLTNPKTILEDPYFSLEDPRLISKNSFTYVKYDAPKVECFLMKDKEALTSGHAWEKNWQFIDQEKYFYKIKPLVIRGPNYKERFEYNMDWKYGDVFHLSSNMFEINDINSRYKIMITPGDVGGILRHKVANYTWVTDYQSDEEKSIYIAQSVSYTHLTLPTTPYV